MEPRIRLAERTDHARCREIEVAADQLFVAVGHLEFADAQPVSSGEFSSAVSDRRALVAEIDGVVAGFAMTDRCGDELYLVQVSVDPACQRRGLGRMLLRRIIDAARERGEVAIVLNTQADVVWNQPFYETLGFVVVPEEQWTEAMSELTAQQAEAGFDWATRVHMRLHLS